jgi:hypothetical protein
VTGGFIGATANKGLRYTAARASDATRGIGFFVDFRGPFLALRAAAIRAAQAIEGTLAALSIPAKKPWSSRLTTASRSSASNFAILGTVTISLTPAISRNRCAITSKAKIIPKSQNSSGSSAGLPQGIAAAPQLAKRL